MARNIDVQKLISDLGGPTTVQDKLSKLGHEITVKGVNMWVYRKRIPGEWISTLVTELGVSLKKYKRSDKGTDDLAFLD